MLEKIKKTRLNSKSIEKGYTLRANINADYVIALKKWNKDYAKEVNAAIKAGDAKAAVKALELAHRANGNQRIREIAANHDSFIYNKYGHSIAVYVWKEEKTYALELLEEEIAEEQRLMAAGM